MTDEAREWERRYLAADREAEELREKVSDMVQLLESYEWPGDYDCPVEMLRAVLDQFDRLREQLGSNKIVEPTVDVHHGITTTNGTVVDRKPSDAGSRVASTSPPVGGTGTPPAGGTTSGGSQ